MDTEQPIEFMRLGAAIGTIEARPDQMERLDECTRRVGAGEFHVPTSELIPVGCIDGRCGCSLKPNAAGGTNTIAVAEDLTNDLDYGYLKSYRATVQVLAEAGLPIGGHDDSHANDQKSGCGACDRLEDIYDFMATRSELLRDLASGLGIEVDDETNELIRANAAARSDFPSGREIKDELDSSGAEIDHLRGEHNEVVAVINLRAGTTLDRDALEAEFGPNYEAFNIDAWAFEAAARATASSEAEVRAKIIAMAYYNLATAHVLCGPGMRVVVLR